MTRWLKVNADAVHHPKAYAAGPWGWAVREAAWHIAKAMDCPGGDITQYWRPDVLAHWSPFLRGMSRPLGYARRGMAAAVEAGLVDHVDGRYVVHDWLEHQAETATARARGRRKFDASSIPLTTSSITVTTEHDELTTAHDKFDAVAPNDFKGTPERVRRRDGDGDGDGDKRTTTPRRVAAPPSKEAYEATDYWLAALPWHQTRGSDQERVRERYAVDMDRLHRLDRRAWEDIRKITDAIAADEGDGGAKGWTGWARNCVAPGKLRAEDRQGRRYWDVIWGQLIDRPRTSASRGHIGVYRSSEHVHDGSGDIWSGDEEETA